MSVKVSSYASSLTQAGVFATVFKGFVRFLKLCVRT